MRGHVEALARTCLSATSRPSFVRSPVGILHLLERPLHMMLCAAGQDDVLVVSSSYNMTRPWHTMACAVKRCRLPFRYRVVIPPNAGETC